MTDGAKELTLSKPLLEGRSLGSWRQYTTLRCLPIDPVDPQMLEKAEKAETVDRRKLTFHDVSGPAIKAIRFTLPLVFVFVLLFPAAAWAASRCPTQGDMYAYCSNFLWVLFVPVFLLMTWWEWNCFRLVVVPYVQWLAPFKILGYEVSLGVWLAFMFMMSSAAKLDIATNSLFAAKILASSNCPGSLWPAAQAAWEEAIVTSSAAHVPLVKQLVYICSFGWIIIILQLVLAFLMSHPWKGVGQTDYQAEGERKGYSTIWTRLCNTCCIDENKIHHADVVRMLAQAIRNLTIMDQSCNWQMERTRQHPTLKGKDLLQQRRCFDMLRTESERAVIHLWAFTILEKAIVMETQTAMYALMRALNKDSDHQIYFTLLVSFMSLIKALFDARSQVATLLGTHQQLVVQFSTEAVAKPAPQNEFTTSIEKFKTWLMGLPEPGELNMQDDVLLQARRAKMIIVTGMHFGIVALTLILAHTFVKIVMAPYCQYGLWNLPLDLASLKRCGCVDLSGITQVMKARQGH